MFSGRKWRGRLRSQDDVSTANDVVAVCGAVAVKVTTGEIDAEVCTSGLSSEANFANFATGSAEEERMAAKGASSIVSDRSF